MYRKEITITIVFMNTNILRLNNKKEKLYKNYNLLFVSYTSGMYILSEISYFAISQSSGTRH